MVNFLIVLVCLVILVKSADVFVDHACALAKKFNISDFVIGFTIVAFGTSMPEMVSTLFASFEGHNQLAVSNILGSNMTNLCLILGITAVIYNFRIHKKDVHLNIPLNMAALIAFGLLLIWSGYEISWFYGLIMISVFILFILTAKDQNHEIYIKKDIPEFNLVSLIASIVFLIMAGQFAVDQIITLAEVFEVDESILGYFVLAIGTSLPELITTLVAVKKHEGELGIGNILGSNMFNLLFITGVSSFINPIDMRFFRIDLIFLTLATLATYLFALKGNKYSFSHKEGVFMIMLYGLFVAFQISR